MVPMTIPWADVFPWAQLVVPGDPEPWTVLPTHPMFPRKVTRSPARHTPEWFLSVGPSDLATIVIPTDVEAINALRSAFDLELIGEQVTAQFWHCPAALTHVQLSRHLRDFHATPLASLGRLGEYETHRWHNGLHQQVSIYPLPVAHIHSREVHA